MVFNLEACSLIWIGFNLGSLQTVARKQSLWDVRDGAGDWAQFLWVAVAWQPGGVQGCLGPRAAYPSRWGRRQWAGLCSCYGP